MDLTGLTIRSPLLRFSVEFETFRNGYQSFHLRSIFSHLELPNSSEYFIEQFLFFEYIVSCRNILVFVSRFVFTSDSGRKNSEIWTKMSRNNQKTNRILKS